MDVDNVEEAEAVATVQSERLFWQGAGGELLQLLSWPAKLDEFSELFSLPCYFWLGLLRCW